MIKAIKALGIEKDWTKTHITDVYALSEKQTGNMINLPQNVVAIREYDKIVFYKDATKEDYNVAFNVGSFSFNNKTITCKKCLPQGIDLKDGLYADYAKISESAVIRFRKDGDVFTKFGGGTKKVNDYFTDKKIPLKDRDTIPLLADEKEVLVIFGVGVSDKIKVDENTKEIIKFDIQ
jgi:tRNA(Ile)-lysidine synthase